MAVKKGTYINIQSFMVNDLKLKGNELLIYAIIFGFSQDKESKFTGSIQYLADWTNSSKRGVMNCLKSLVEKGLITKENNYVNNLKFCKYVANFTSEESSPVGKNKVASSEQSSTGVVNKVPQGSEQSSPNKLDNTIYKKYYKKEESQAKELASLLLSKSRNLDKKFRLGKDNETITSWSTDIEKLIRIDKRDYQEIADVINWCKTDGCFWAPNIQSGRKLREKFSTLYLQMKEKPAGKQEIKRYELDINKYTDSARGRE